MSLVSRPKYVKRERILFQLTGVYSSSLLPSLPMLLPAKASSYSRASPRAIQTPLWLCPLLYSSINQQILLSQLQYSSLGMKFGAYKAKQKIQVTLSSLLCNVRSFLVNKAFAVGTGETMRCFQRETGLPEPKGAPSLAAWFCHYRAARSALRLQKSQGQLRH